jgi:hypothetical protein
MHERRRDIVNCFEINLQHSRTLSSNLGQPINQHNFDITYVQEPYTINNKLAGLPRSHKVYTFGDGRKRTAIVINNWAVWGSFPRVDNPNICNAGFLNLFAYLSSPSFHETWSNCPLRAHSGFQLRVDYTKFSFGWGLQNSCWAYPRRGNRVLAFQVCFALLSIVYGFKVYTEESQYYFIVHYVSCCACSLVLINHC